MCKPGINLYFPYKDNLPTLFVYFDQHLSALNIYVHYHSLFTIMSALKVLVTTMVFLIKII